MTDDTASPGELRVEELARTAGVTVRSVRIYQERGLLPPPRREGRVAWYGPAHLARLRLIGQLLDRGWTFAAMGELLRAWEQGRELSDVLGLEQELAGAWSDEVPAWYTSDELAGVLGLPPSDGLVEALAGTGLVVADGERLRAESPRLVAAAAALIAAGVPVGAITALAADLRRDTEHTAGALVQAVADAVREGRPPGWLPSAEELPELLALVRRLRPLAQVAVDVYLVRALQDSVRSLLGDVLSAAGPAPAGPAPTGPAPTGG